MRQRTAKLIRRVARLGGVDPRSTLKQFKRDLPIQPLSHKLWGRIGVSLRRTEAELRAQIEKERRAKLSAEQAK